MRPLSAEERGKLWTWHGTFPADLVDRLLAERDALAAEVERLLPLVIDRYGVGPICGCHHRRTALCPVALAAKDPP